MSKHINDVSGCYPLLLLKGQQAQNVVNISTPWYWNFSCLIYIYPIIPHAPAFLHSFLFPVIVAKGIGPRRHLYFCLLVLEFLPLFYILSDSSSRTSFFKQLPITSDCCKGYRLETSLIFLLIGTGIFLVLFDIYPIVPHAPAFLQRFHYL